MSNIVKSDRRISKSEFRRLLKELRDEAKSCGFTVRFRWKQVHFYPFFCFTNGWCEVYTKRLYLKVYGRPARREILQALAHEVRHAIHVRDGLFKDYYKRHTLYCTFNEKTAFLAENDCNHWADKWLQKHNIKPFKIPYYYTETGAYQWNHRSKADRIKVLKYWRKREKAA